jgi:LysM repeat protein
MSVLAENASERGVRRTARAPMLSGSVLSMTGIALLLLCGPAHARVVLYAARSGDTPESIAADYYGNRTLALFIVEGNGLEREARLRPGQKLRIPTAFHYKVRRGDTLEALAQRFLDDKRRAAYLAGVSGIKVTDRLREGQDLVIPFQHVHRADAPESLSSVARAFYGDAGQARVLAEYNFHPAPMLAKGERILVPISHVRIRAVRLAQAALQQPPPPAGGRAVSFPLERTPAIAAASVEEARRREAELAQRVGQSLRAAEQSYKEGSYAEVPAALDKLLTEEDPSEAQLAEIFRLKAFAYVALGMEELAESAFREVIARKPDLVLGEATVSPKIRAALDRARKARAQ